MESQKKMVGISPQLHRALKLKSAMVDKPICTLLDEAGKEYLRLYEQVHSSVEGDNE